MVKQSCAYWPFLVTEKTVLAKVLNFVLIFRRIPIPEIVAAVTEINYKPQEMQVPQQQGTVGRDKLDRSPHQVQHAKQLVTKGPSQLVLEPMSDPLRSLAETDTPKAMIPVFHLYVWHLVEFMRQILQSTWASTLAGAAPWLLDWGTSLAIVSCELWYTHTTVHVDIY